MLCPSQLIKLIVVTTAEIQKALSRVKEFTVNFFIVVVQYSDRLSLAIELLISRWLYRGGDFVTVSIALLV